MLRELALHRKVDLTPFKDILKVGGAAVRSETLGESRANPLGRTCVSLLCHRRRALVASAEPPDAVRAAATGAGGGSAARVHAPQRELVHRRCRPVFPQRDAQRAAALRAAQHHHGAAVPAEPAREQVRAGAPYSWRNCALAPSSSPDNLSCIAPAGPGGRTVRQTGDVLVQDRVFQRAFGGVPVNVLHRVAADAVLLPHALGNRLPLCVRSRASGRPTAGTVGDGALTGCSRCARDARALDGCRGLVAPSDRYYVNGFMGGLSVLLEAKSRRIELAMYCAPRALESFWNSLAKRGLVRNIPYARIALRSMPRGCIATHARVLTRATLRVGCGGPQQRRGGVLHAGHGHAHGHLPKRARRLERHLPLGAGRVGWQDVACPGPVGAALRVLVVRPFSTFGHT